jgi:hypothetical protein
VRRKYEASAQVGAIGDRNKTHRTRVNFSSIACEARRFAVNIAKLPTIAGRVHPRNRYKRAPFMGEVVGAVVLLLARATARLASACAPGLRGAAAAAVLAASQVPQRRRTPD